MRPISRDAVPIIELETIGRKEVVAMKISELMTKFELLLRPLQLGEGQRHLDEIDGLAKETSASETEHASQDDGMAP